ncbi:GAF domain-containing protein [Modestobacter sp. SYSU DS0290]
MRPPLVDDLAPFEDWTGAVRASLTHLHRTIGLDVWMLTEVTGDEQVVLHAHPREAVPAGTAFPWARTFCRAMVSGTGPRVATVTAAVPVYSQLLAGHPERIAAYIGVPLVTRSGELFGTLCGFSARAQPRSMARFLPTVEHTARLLSTLMPAGQDGGQDGGPVSG